MSTTRVEYLNPEGACPVQGLYSHVAKMGSGPLLFIAGQVSIDARGALVGKDDVESQFRQVFENLGAVLKGMGVGFDDVVKFTTFLVRSQDIERFMKVRAELFPRIFKGPLYPPNTLLVVDRLVREDLLIEVEAVARGVD